MQTKKLLGSTLALALIGSSVSVNAELPKNFKLSGELDLQGTAAQNVNDFSTHRNTVAGHVATNNDRIGDMQTLLLLNADWDILDDVHAKVTLDKNDRTWGNKGNNPQNDGLGQPIGSTNAGNTNNGVLGNTFVDQAYVKVDKVFGAVDTTLGRQFFGQQGDVVAYFGPHIGIYGMPVSALDTARFDWSSDMIGITGIVGKQVGSAVGAVDAKNTDLRALIATIKSGDMFKGNVYVYDQVSHALGASGVGGVGNFGGAATPNGTNNNLWVAGLRGAVNMGMAWAKAEFDKNFGDDRTGGVTTDKSTYTGWAAKLDVGAKVDAAGAGSVSPWGTFVYATGQGDTKSSHNNKFTPIAGDFRAGDIWTRFNSLAATGLGAGVAALGGGAVGSNNVGNNVIWGLGLKVSPAALTKLTAAVGYWDYRTQTSATPTANGGQQAFQGNHHIGSEADLDLTWKHSENVSFTAGLGRFWAGGIINNAIQGSGANAFSGQGVNPATSEWFDVNIKF